MTTTNDTSAQELNWIKTEERLDNLRKKIVNEIKMTKGYFRRMWEWTQNLFSAGPREEIAQDWLIIHSWADDIREGLLSSSKMDDDKTHALAKVLAYLELARRERDYAEAWSYINLADASLTLLVEEEDVEACCVRQKTVECFIPKNLREQLEEYKTNAPHDPNLGLTAARQQAYREQLARSVFWNIANRAVVLKQHLWWGVGMWLFIGLVVAIVVVSLELSTSPPGTSWMWRLADSRYPKIALLGFFGGALSSFLSARKMPVDIRQYALIKVHTVLRMLLGAAGAFVLYVVIQWPGVMSDKFQGSLNNDFVFVSLGILAGFSERLFIGTLEKIAENISIAGPVDGKPVENN